MFTLEVRLRTGVTKDLHSMIYAGVPADEDAHLIAAEALREMGLE
jgi:hypothetical protein